MTREASTTGRPLSNYPCTIENGAGERLTFTRRTPVPGGERVEGSTVVSPGAGPPLHVHYLQDEAFTVLSGRIGYQRGDREPEYAEAGASILFPAGEPHRFWNAGTEDLHCSAYIEPPGNVEYFLAAVFASQLANGGRRPRLMDIAFLTRRYRTEFGMLAIPGAVQRWVFPVLVVIGRMLGMYDKYADAPLPLRGPGQPALPAATSR